VLFKRSGLAAGLVAFVIVGLACGPSNEEIDQRIEQRVRETLSRLPTPTPISFPTPLPTATLVPKPVTLEEMKRHIERRVQEILSGLPTPTPISFPTPLPTATLVPTPTPYPVATPVSLEEINRIIEQRVHEILSGLPTLTPVSLPPTPTPQRIVDFSVLYRQTWSSVFFIDTLTGSGSGWLIEPGFILTNQHVVRENSIVMVRQSADPPFEATVVAVDSSRDIALLQFDPANVQLHSQAAPLPLGQISSNNIAQTLMALGYSEGSVKEDGTVGSTAANVGVLSQIIDFGPSGFGLNLVMDAPVDPGDSGGPVLSSDGLVVGMTRAAVERTAGGQRVLGTFYAVHVDEIRAALQALKGDQPR